MTDTTQINETTQQVIQVFPEHLQPLLGTLAAIAMGLLSIGAFLWPFISKWASNRQVAAINDNAISTEDIEKAIESKLASYEKARLISEISNWKYKLIYATDETRPIIEGEIQKLELELQKYA